jgi:endonuclease/exonuclease/phosphatase (EEP) superfamily protein YafD
LEQGRPIADIGNAGARIAASRRSDGRNDRKRQREIRSILVGLAIVLLVLLVLPSFHSLWWAFELPGHFRLHIAVLASLLGVFTILRSHRIASVIGFIAAGASWAVIATVPVAARSADSGVIVVSQNLSHRNDDASGVVAMLEGEDADIVLLQEYTPFWDVALDSFRSGYPYAVTVPQAGAFGIAVFSKIPIEGYEILRLGVLETPFIVLELHTGAFKGYLVAVHFQSPMIESWSEDRNRQFDELTSYLTSLDFPYLIVGDFNNTPYAPTMREFMKKTRTYLASPYPSPTWPVQIGTVGIPIDAALGTADIQFGAGSTLAPIGSDHRGIRILFASRL